MSIDLNMLRPLGWGNDFSIQLSLEQLTTCRPARVIGVERGHYRVDIGETTLIATLAGAYRYQHERAQEFPTVGDWVLLDPDEPLILERLERRTLIARKAAGSIETQPIAANIDVLLIVSGLDGDYKRHRIERYLVLAAQAHVTPIVLLTKADLVMNTEGPLGEVRQVLPSAGEVFAVNALDDSLDTLLSPWLTPGTTLALVGSSGVGKSSVVNNLTGTDKQRTQATRRDAKGRHTTTSRNLIRLPGEVCIIDVPGMRELGLAPTEGGVDKQFREISMFAEHCRFSDCTHQQEPGCAVRAAVERGELPEDLWQHYLKLLAEERHNITEHERRRKDKAFGKMVRNAKVIKENRSKE